MLNKADQLTQEQFDEKYGAKYKQQTFKEVIKNQLGSFSKINGKNVLSWLPGFIPSLKWIPKYKLKSYILPDVLTGITIGIMNIPQGMAYGMLAGLDPVHGLYTSFFLPLVYTFFGTSKHVALGVFAVVSLMVGEVVDKLVPLEFTGSENGTANAQHMTNESCQFCYWCGSSDSIAPRNLTVALQVASTLTICVGIIQVVLGLLRLGFLAVLLSDQLVQGLTTGASIHVFTTQINKIFGLSIHKNPEPLGIIKFYGCLIIHITESNIATLITSLVCIVCLIITKEFIDPKTRPKIKFPIPIELFVVMGTTLVSWKVNLTNRYHVKIVGHIPSGIQKPQLPELNLWFLEVLPYAFTIAIVIYSIEVSLAKLFAKKHEYKIDPNQEWIGVGLAHIVASFFYCHCGGPSMSRTLIQSNQGAKSQVPSLVSSSILLVVLLWLASFFQDLPKCALSCIIIVALKGMYKQILVLPSLFRKSKIDFMIWVVTFVAVVCLNVSLGLGFAVIFAMVTTLFRSMWPEKNNLGKVPDGNNLFKEVNGYKIVDETPGVKIFRFEAPLFFGNSEKFTQVLYSHAGEDPLLLKKRRTKLEKKAKKLQNKSTVNSKQNLVSSYSTETLQTISENTELGTMKSNGTTSRHQDSDLKCIIVDCSSIPYVDVMGVDVLARTYEDYKAVQIAVLFADCKTSILRMFDQCNFYKKVPKTAICISLSGAVSAFEKLMGEKF